MMCNTYGDAKKMLGDVIVPDAIIVLKCLSILEVSIHPVVPS